MEQPRFHTESPYPSKKGGNAPYPQPGPVGGTLIRSAIRTLRREGISAAGQLELPFKGPVLVAVSGGSDSVALLTLLARYGRRICPRDAIRVVHFDHRWRGAEASDREVSFVADLCTRLGLAPPVVRPFRGNPFPAGESAEAVASHWRRLELEALRESLGPQAVVLTAHHADDQAESRLIALMTGTFLHSDSQIAVGTGEGFCRPFLYSAKSDLQAFLRDEEQVTWCEDPTNQSAHQRRAQLRQSVLPALDCQFPRWKEHLADLFGLVSAGAPQAGVQKESRLRAGLRVRRAQFEQWLQLTARGAREGEVTLPGGWSLVRTRGRTSGEPTKGPKLQSDLQ